MIHLKLKIVWSTWCLMIFYPMLQRLLIYCYSSYEKREKRKRENVCSHGRKAEKNEFVLSNPFIRAIASNYHINLWMLHSLLNRLAWSHTLIMKFPHMWNTEGNLWVCCTALMITNTWQPLHEACCLLSKRRSIHCCWYTQLTWIPRAPNTAHQKTLATRKEKILRCCTQHSHFISGFDDLEEGNKGP